MAYGTSDLDLLRVVFSFHVVDRIMHADHVLSVHEIDWVRQRFPREMLAANSLIDEDDVLTDRYRDLLAEALMRLPAELDEVGKITLIEQFFSSALADGNFEYREGHLIVAAARLLGLPLEALTDLLNAEDGLELVDLDARSAN